MVKPVLVSDLNPHGYALIWAGYMNPDALKLGHKKLRFEERERKI
jgi:hypothetical protein